MRIRLRVRDARDAQLVNSFLDAVSIGRMRWKLALLMILVPGLAGMAQLLSYSNRPGEVGESVPEKLPQGIAAFHPNETTVLFFYHPHCPCTRATIRCLERLVVGLTPKPRITAYAYVPPSETDAWIESELTEKLRTLDNVLVVADRDAKACQRFDIATSGHLLVYSEDGKLSFSGGITPSRGHEGGCESGASFVKTVNGQSETKARWPVFGCPIVRPGEEG